MLFNAPFGVLLIHAQLSERAISPSEVCRTAVLYALLLAVGAFGSLHGAHAILAAREAGACNIGRPEMYFVRAAGQQKWSDEGRGIPGATVFHGADPGKAAASA